MRKYIAGLLSLLSMMAAAGQRRYTKPQRTARIDTVAFAFDKADWHSGDTLYLHSLSPFPLRRYYERNIRGIYHGDTPVVGTVTLQFYIDMTGKFTGVFLGDSSASPELREEVMRVTRQLDKIPLAPTTVAGSSFVSKVKLKIVFEKASDYPPVDLSADIVVKLSEVEY